MNKSRNRYIYMNLDSKVMKICRFYSTIYANDPTANLLQKFNSFLDVTKYANFAAHKIL